MLSSFCVIVGCFLVPVSQIIFASTLDTFDYGLAGWSAGYCRLDPCWSNPYKTFDSVMNFAHCHPNGVARRSPPQTLRLAALSPQDATR